MSYQPHADDTGFLLLEVLQAPAQLSALSAYADVDTDLLRQVLTEAAKFVAEVVATEDGGQALPEVLNQVLYEWLSAANHGWTMAPGLLHGAYECLKHHGSAELQAQYLSKIASGEWLATMCLTEPQADGSYRLSGSKIFISGGEHDLSDNIVHLVLARLPDAPPGPKGLSLFLVPKFYEDSSRSSPGGPGTVNRPSAATCTA